MSETCSEMVATDRGFRMRRCLRAAMVERDGRRWCHQHDPAMVAARAARRSAVWQAETARARWERAAIAACAGVDDPQPGELLRLRSGGDTLGRPEG